EISLCTIRSGKMLNLKELREEKGITRYQLAKLTELQNSTIRSIETEVKNPGFLTVKKYAMHYKLISLM
ncbi:helix-turn-helix transcriptional regulator, partial [Streptococcus pyogenes]